MLKCFRIENAYSYKDSSTIDFSADYAKKDLWQFVRNVEEEHFLPAIALYGSNAGGKTNLCNALIDFIENIYVRRDLTKRNRKWGFLLTPNYDEIINHEVSLYLKNSEGHYCEFIYKYAFSRRPRKFFKESLVYKNTGTQKETGFDRQDNSVEFIGDYALEHQAQIKNVAKNTDTLIINALGQAIAGYGISEIFNWCKNVEYQIEVLGEIDMLESSMDLAREIAFDKDTENRLSSFISKFDKSLCGVSPRQISDDNSNEYELHIQHNISSGKASVRLLPFEFQSNGTKKIINLYTKIWQCLQKGSLLVVDELDTMLHPSVFRKILETFNDIETNPNNAQLVFTAHNPFVMNREDLRRDQIFIIDKDEYGCSFINRLSDIQDEFGKPIRSDAKYDKQYLVGTLGSYPYDFKDAYFYEGFSND